MDKKEKHFVLVHGGCHGAWCWYKLVTPLRSNGHKVTALDMAACGVDPKSLKELNSFSDYAEPLMQFMAGLPPDNRVVMVGYSLGGVAMTLAMEKFPKKIVVAVFLTAFMPGPHLSLCTIMQEIGRREGSSMDNQLAFDNGEDRPPTSFVIGTKYLSANLYQLSTPEDLSLAELLVRPLPLFADEELLKATVITKENYGSVRRVYVISEKDKVIEEELQRLMIEKNKTDEVKLIADSDHMVMFSKHRELFSCLQEITQNY